MRSAKQVEVVEMNHRANTMRNAVIALVALAVVAGGSVAGYLKAVAAPTADLAVASATVKTGTIQSSVPADGRVAAEEWTLAFAVAGTVDSVLVSAGETVTAGQVLATLDDGKVKAQVAQAQGAVDAANARLAGLYAQPRSQDVAAKQALVDAAETALASAREAYSLLVAESVESTVPALELQSKRAAVSSAQSQLSVAEANLAVAKTPAAKAEIDAAKAAVEQALGGLDAAKAALADLNLVAPSDGVVISMNLKPGMAPPSGAGALPAMVIGDLGTMYVEGALDETDLGDVRVGMPVEVLVDALDGESLEGTVSYVSSVAEVDGNGVAAYAIRVDLPDHTVALGVGMSVRLQVVTDRVSDVLVIPTAAVRRVDGASTVDILSADGTLVPAKVDLGQTDGTMVEVRSGLTAGAKVALPQTGVES
ncbi:MAG: hypothetical protein CVT59_06250 [Actinobacteria bacterium HGW-Actinobacteria-1]|jgi:RND family efflux transporter MFP subunit|nr:MAG: hypothetical protein CVT59_06250 [Actinobacteria bacterium HGW-Actinobacteria-1]